MTTEVLKGVLKPDGTLELESSPQLPAGPVEVVLHSVPSPTAAGDDWWEYLQRARAQAEASGTPFRTEAQIELEREDFRTGDERVEDVHRRIEEEPSGGTPDA